MRIEIEIPDEAKPGRYGVYVLSDDGGQILYIGHTQNLFQRLNNHRSLKPWWRDVRSLEWVPCQGYAEARSSEKALISLYAPIHNDADTVELQVVRRQRPRTPELPDWTVARLTEMREAEAAAGKGASPARERLDSYVLSLRNAGWTLEVIGRGLGMTRERVRQRQVRATKPLKGANVPPVPRKPVPVKKVKSSIPLPVLAEMMKLQPLARKVNGPTPLDHPNRVASERYTELIAEQYVAGVSIYRIANQLGVTHLAIRARLARHGYTEPIKGLTANTPYGTPWAHGKRDECKRGHSLTDEVNVQIINSRDGKVRRACRTCDRIRSDAYRARKKAS